MRALIVLFQVFAAVDDVDAFGWRGVEAGALEGVDVRTLGL